MAHTADMGIYYSTDPAVLSTGIYPITTSVGGRLHISSNPGLTTAENAFPRLTRVQERCAPTCAWSGLNIELNDNLATLGNAFPALVELGSDRNGIALSVSGNSALTTLGSAFASLRRIPGRHRFQNNPLLTDFEALRNVECHGGIFQNFPTPYCQNCPAWLLALPRC